MKVEIHKRSSSFETFFCAYENTEQSPTILINSSVVVLDVGKWVVDAIQYFKALIIFRVSPSISHQVVFCTRNSFSLGFRDLTLAQVVLSRRISRRSRLKSSAYQSTSGESKKVSEALRDSNPRSERSREPPLDFRVPKRATEDPIAPTRAHLYVTEVMTLAPLIQP